MKIKNFFKNPLCMLVVIAVLCINMGGRRGGGGSRGGGGFHSQGHFRERGGRGAFVGRGYAPVVVDEIPFVEDVDDDEVVYPIFPEEERFVRRGRFVRRRRR